MLVTMLKSKIHRATVTGADVDYEGSIAIDSELLELAGIAEFEQVHVADVDNGSRLVTYAIAAPRGSREFVVNGAAARLVETGHTIIIMSYAVIDAGQATQWEPTVVRLGEFNRVISRVTPS